jgi:hypothetical protein
MQWINAEVDVFLSFSFKYTLPPYNSSGGKIEDV